MIDKRKIKRHMKEYYANVVSKETSRCPIGDNGLIEQAVALGYTPEELRHLPKGALAGLGCGNPLVAAALRKGETVLDLGSGCGRDALLAAFAVGEKGRVIGVDMTPQMVEKANENAKEGNYRNVIFKRAELEALPVEDNSVDCIISNCVINHSQYQTTVFKEAFRVLKRGGRMLISDLVIEGDLSPAIRASLVGSSACLTSSLEKQPYLDSIREAGFLEIVVLSERPFEWEGIDLRLAGKVTSVQIKAFK